MRHQHHMQAQTDDDKRGKTDLPKKSREDGQHQRVTSSKHVYTTTTTISIIIIIITMYIKYSMRHAVNQAIRQCY